MPTIQKAGHTPQLDDVSMPSLRVSFAVNTHHLQTSRHMHQIQHEKSMEEGGLALQSQASTA